MLREEFKRFNDVHRHHIGILYDALVHLIKAHLQVHHRCAQGVYYGVVFYLNEIFLKLIHGFTQTIGETIECFPVRNEEAPQILMELLLVLHLVCDLR
jgi:hypothetical protein